MGWNIDQALDDELVTVVERNDRDGTYRIRVGTLRAVVTIRLKTPSGKAYTEFTQSHAIRTPVNSAGAYRTRRPSNDTPGSALHQAISGLTTYYKSAVTAGHTPEEDWLEPY